MKASDLRIGNLVYNTEIPTETQIKGIEENRLILRDSYFPYTPLEKIAPIPLTEEWLLKLGFIKDESLKVNDIYLKDWGDFYFTVSVNNNSFHLRVSNHSFYHQNITGLGIIQSVHQLQNLYHAITGEELTLKN